MVQNIAAIRQLLEQIRDERKTHANTATRVGNALLMLLGYMTDSDNPFLRKDQDDVSKFLLTLQKGLVVGESGDIRLNPDGSITCSSIHVNGSAIFDELVINEQSVTSGDQIYSDRGVIDKVDYCGECRYKLTFRKEYDADVVSFKVHDVLRSRTNDLQANGISFTSWYRVVAVDYAANEVDVLLYPDDEVPGGKNYLPLEASVVSRWGNAVDQGRQQVFFLSSLDGRFCFLQNVTKPIINDEGSNTTAFIGLPNDVPALRQLIDEGSLTAGKPILYAETAVVENLITVKHDGTPDYTQREWIAWEEERQYIRGYDETEKRHVQDNVWYGGSLWRCIVAKATVGQPPSLHSTEWACIRSAELKLEIESSNGDWFNASKSFNTTLVATITHGDIQLSADSVVWTRESGDDAGDEAWNMNQAKKDQTMSLAVSYNLEQPELSDIPVPVRYDTKIGFRCTVTVTDRTLTHTYTI